MDNRTALSSFGKWIRPICAKTFINAVAECQQDKYTKKLTTTAYLNLFLLAQLQNREGLRHIADDVLGEELQRELGLTSISASQLSRKHNQVDPELLRHVFEQVAKLVLLRQGTKGKQFKIKIIDSTTVTLCLQKFKWAEFRKTKAGIKIHTRLAFMNEHEVLPDKATVTVAKKNDRTQMEELVDEPGVTYIFDRGYIDYAAFDRYSREGILFVTRLKSNTHMEPLEAYDVPAESVVSADWRVRIGSQQKRMKHELRMIQTQDSEGNELFLVTNRFDLTCDEISEMYRSRWAIELFFKWIKQHLQIKHLYGTSERAVMNQIWIALIAFCLLMLVKLETKVQHSLLQCTRWLTTFLWQPYDKWLRQLKEKPSRTSKGRQRTRVEDSLADS
ncbi:IS4 family transposase [Paenibacillus herberti]|uniref:IS4 family transposase n=1 Tax=Paenibacillus herberti TaxID=1619309 RepID=A0A229NZX6_9BACL|nr:IS4 family transposase [Paenibacillus herberti]OXM15532.1 IS4 family transposase [Paenibacillus herberti]